MIKILCVNCGEEVFIYPSWLVRRKTCSRQCAGKLTAIRLYDFLHRPNSEQAKRKMSIIKKSLRGEKTNNWKGDNVGYRGIHHWVKGQLGKPLFCSNNKQHQASYYHWANISGEYKRDLNDWQSLCPKCNKNDGVTTSARFRRESGQYYS